jgi:hypothetical protein
MPTIDQMRSANVKTGVMACGRASGALKIAVDKFNSESRPD